MTTSTTPRNPNTHSEFISLREYIEQKLQSMELATKVAYESMNKRLDAMNEFRATIKDHADTLVPKNECRPAMTRLEEDVRSLRESRSVLEGKASQSSVVWLTLVSVAGLATGVISLAIRLTGK